jgi:hypothetical protein
MLLALGPSKCGGAHAEVTAALLFAMQQIDRNSCPFYCMKIVISLVKGML